MNLTFLHNCEKSEFGLCCIIGLNLLLRLTRTIANSLQSSRLVYVRTGNTQIKQKSCLKSYRFKKKNSHFLPNPGLTKRLGQLVQFWRSQTIIICNSLVSAYSNFADKNIFEIYNVKIKCMNLTCMLTTVQKWQRPDTLSVWSQASLVIKY